MGEGTWQTECKEKWKEGVLPQIRAYQVIWDEWQMHPSYA